MGVCNTWTGPLSNSQAAFMLEQCLTWLEHQPEANVYKTTLLRQLQKRWIIWNKQTFQLSLRKMSY